MARWHVGPSVRSAREGWLRGRYNDRGWPVFETGNRLPRSADGSWIRNSFKVIMSKYSDYLVEAEDFTPGSRFFVNAIEIRDLSPGVKVSIARQVSGGMNQLAFYFPPGAGREAKVPKVTLYGVSRRSGRELKLVTLRTWRFRSEKLEKEIPESWIKSPFSYGWFLRIPRIPAGEDGWLGEGPVCVKAVLDFPHYWARRNLTAYFHEIPGSPALYINGRKVTERVESPLKVELGPYLEMKGRDVVSLVYDRPPRAHDSGNWGIAAVNWGEDSPGFPFKPGLRLVYDSAGAASQPGALQAIRYVSQILSLSSTSYEIDWRFVPDGDYSSVCVDAGLIASWSATPFSSSNLERAREELVRRFELARANMGGTLWLVSSPTAGRKLMTAENSRLGAFGRRVSDMAGERNAKLVPVADVFRSALRKQRRWPAGVEFADSSGRLGIHGSYLMALVILTAFSLP